MKIINSIKVLIIIFLKKIKKKYLFRWVFQLYLKELDVITKNILKKWVIYKYVYF